MSKIIMAQLKSSLLAWSRVESSKHGNDVNANSKRWVNRVRDYGYGV